MKLDLATQEHTYHLQEYTRAMLALRRDASTPEQRAGIERLYFRVTGKRLQDVLEQYIIETLEK